MIFVYAVFMELFCVFILNFVCYIGSFMSEVLHHWRLLWYMQFVIDFILDFNTDLKIQPRGRKCNVCISNIIIKTILLSFHFSNVHKGIRCFIMFNQTPESSWNQNIPCKENCFKFCSIKLWEMKNKCYFLSDSNTTKSQYKLHFI
jgi:hypothetical protein